MRAKEFKAILEACLDNVFIMYGREELVTGCVVRTKGDKHGYPEGDYYIDQLLMGYDCAPHAILRRKEELNNEKELLVIQVKELIQTNSRTGEYYFTRVYPEWPFEKGEDFNYLLSVTPTLFSEDMNTKKEVE